MNKKLIRIIVSAVLLAGAVIIEKTTELPVWQLLIVYLIPYILIGYDVIMEAIEGLGEGRAFNGDFLMCVATIGAFCIGFLPGAETQFPEAVFVMLFYQVGELFEHFASEKSRRSIANLMDIRPDSANVLRNGEVVAVKPETLRVGEIIVIKPGEKVPLDGVAVEGSSSLNTVALTGESVPRDVTVEDEVVSGCINISGVLKVRVTKSYGESTASKIIELVENASENKSKSESFIDRFARVYTPIVVFAAIALAFVPPLFSGAYMNAFPTWLYRALTFLIVSCPCALVISVPLSFFGGIGGAGRNGILIKGGGYMDVLSKARAVVFDKTGTLTKGEFVVTAVHPHEISENHLLHIAAHVERYSTHPIAISLKNAYPNEDDGCKVENVTEVPGQGIRANVNGDELCVGNAKMMEAIGVEWKDCHSEGTIVHVAVNGKYAGHIVIADKVKPDSKAAIAALKAKGVERIVMLTGDKEKVAAAVARTLNIDEYYSEMLPADKVSKVEILLKEGRKDAKLAFVGDGINDAPVLARADVGIAMGGLGADAALEAADIVLMDDNPLKIVRAIDIARHTIAIARQNVAFAIIIKVLVLVLAAFGVARLWMAVFADVGVTVLVVLNAMRTLRIKGGRK